MNRKEEIIYATLELVNSMYSFLREKAQMGVRSPSGADLFSEDKRLREILSDSVSVYFDFLSDENMMKFFKVLYSERSISPIAAQIMLDETDRYHIIDKLYSGSDLCTFCFSGV